MDKEKFRVYLRALEPDDCLKTHKWRNDPVYQEGIVSVKRFISLDTEKRWVENAIKEHEKMISLRFGIVLKETNELIGISILKKIDFINRQAKYSIFMGESRGKGLATEAHLLVFDYVFMDLGLERISGGILEDNIASLRAVEKAGFVREGVSRNAVFKSGKFMNVIEVSMIKSDFISKFMTD